MKLPFNPTYTKDRTLTRRTVKGAAGGLKGVDYEDDWWAQPGAERRPVREGAGLRPGEEGARRAAAQAQAEGRPQNTREGAEGTDQEDETILDDEDAVTRDAKARRNRQNLARDRLSVDKDAPEIIRERSWDSEEEEPAEDEEEDRWQDLDAIGEAIADAPSRAALFQTDERPPPGTPGLTDPAEIRRFMETPVRYAQHAMLLAEAFMRHTGATRAEGVAYLARLFMALPDPAFSQAAFRQLGPATGIIDIYPLEVVEHIIEDYPAFLPRHRFGRVFHTEQASLLVDPGEEAPLYYEPTLKIRGFGVKGGGELGYRFEPSEARDAYTLSIEASGRFTLLVCGRRPSGETELQRLEVTVTGEAAPRPAPPPRDAAAVEAWPMPALVEISAPAPAKPSGALFLSELGRRQQLDALHGPKGEQADALFMPSAAQFTLREGAEPRPAARMAFERQRVGELPPVEAKGRAGLTEDAPAQQETAPAAQRVDTDPAAPEASRQTDASTDPAVPEAPEQRATPAPAPTEPIEVETDPEFREEAASSGTDPVVREAADASTRGTDPVVREFTEPKAAGASPVAKGPEPPSSTDPLVREAAEQLETDPAVREAAAPIGARAPSATDPETELLRSLPETREATELLPTSASEEAATLPRTTAADPKPHEATEAAHTVVEAPAHPRALRVGGSLTERSSEGPQLSPSPAATEPLEEPSDPQLPLVEFLPEEPPRDALRRALLDLDPTPARRRDALRAVISGEAELPPGDAKS